MPPRRKVLNPRFPRDCPGAIEAKADRGNKAVDVSGLLMDLPSTDGSSRFGRSPLEPSTLPEPGPSEPVITVKGRPLLARSVPEIRQLLVARRTRRLPEESGGEYWRRTITACD